MAYISRPKWMEDLWYVVDDALRSGVTPKQFLDEVSECWAQSLRDRLKDEPELFRSEK